MFNYPLTTIVFLVFLGLSAASAGDYADDVRQELEERRASEARREQQLRPAGSLGPQQSLGYERPAPSRWTPPVPPHKPHGEPVGQR